jgi:hypothetical protein
MPALVRARHDLAIACTFMIVGCTGDNAKAPWEPMEVASGLNVVTQPSDAISGRVMTPQPVISVVNSRNEVITRVSLMVSAKIVNGQGTLAGNAAVKVVDGMARFSDLRVNGAGPHALEFSTSGIRGATSNSFAVSQLPAALAVVTQPAGATIGSPLATQPVIAIVDEGGVAVGDATTTVTASVLSGSGALFGTTTVNAVGGVARFTDLAISGAGPHQLQFSAVNLNNAASNSFTILDQPGVATRLAVATQPSGATSGAPFGQQPVIEVRDDANQIVTGASPSVTASLASGSGTLSGTLTITATNGVASFSDLRITGSGLHSLTLSSSGLSAGTSAQFNVAPGAAANLAITRQPASTVQSAVAFSPQPVIQLVDATGTPVPLAGVPVAASIATGGGTLDGTTTVTTNQFGVAGFSNLSITGTLGDRTLAFTAPPYPSVTSSTVSVIAGRPAQLAINTQPSSTAQNTVPFAIQPVVQLLDADGNPSLQSGIVVTAALASGPGATLGGTTSATTDASGLARFTNLSLTGTVGAYTLTFNSATAVSAISGSITTTAGPATKLAVATQPSSSANGIPLAPQPVIQVQDVSGNDVDQSGVVVNVVIASGGGTLTGTPSATTNAAGTASFTDLAIIGTVGNRTLRFTSTGLTSVTSAAFAITVGPPSQLSITTQPSSSAPTGVSFGRQPAVQLRDVAGNAVNQSGVAIGAEIASGGGVLGGTLTATTNASGVATFGNLSITGTPGPRTLRFTGASLTPVTSNAIDITDPASQLTITTQPSATASSGAAFTRQPVLQLRDAAGNAVSQTSVVITATVASGTGTLGGNVSATTNVNGIATFTNLSLTGTGDHTLRFSAAGLSGATSDLVTLTAGPVPFIHEDFSTYASTADLRADPRSLYMDSEDINVSQAFLDATTGVGGSTQSMRYDYPANGSVCRNHTISRSMRISRTEIWVEWYAKYSSNFSMVAGVPTGCGIGWKFLLIWLDGGNAGRFGFHWTIGRTDMEGPTDNYDAFLVWGSIVRPETLFDGQWHRYRYHARISGGVGFHEGWIDDTYLGSKSATTSARTLDYMSLARNLNQGPLQAQSLWWGKISVYDRSPGW